MQACSTYDILAGGPPPSSEKKGEDPPNRFTIGEKKDLQEQPCLLLKWTNVLCTGCGKIFGQYFTKRLCANSEGIFEINMYLLSIKHAFCNNLRPCDMKTKQKKSPDLRSTRYIGRTAGVFLLLLPPFFFTFGMWNITKSTLCDIFGRYLQKKPLLKT